MKIKFLLCFMLLTISFSSLAKPKFLVKHQRNTKNLAEIQIINQTTKALVCHVAIDGYKIRFRLQPRQPSKWFTATKPSFNYSNFSTWCDYLSLYPKYQKKT
ncbi:MAG: hypothetical protein OQK09_03870 [Colwellia sp.]|nr:hypothetical protein [Colwellia sp.]MCW8866481.1 hypothetical protein [Colwellia sp.]MCW9080625.1 hypothetical protein [Colwellia sp.]